MKQKWKPGNMIYPLPAVMVSCGNHEHANIITIAWTGTICTNPPMTYVSIRPSRYSYELIKETGCFVINLTTRRLTKATDYCGVKSGKDRDKFKDMRLTPSYENETHCPMIDESPVNIECKVKEIHELGSHHMFIADILNVYVDPHYIDEKGKFHLNKTDLIAYSHGAYLTLGKEIGTFGYSIKSKKKVKNTNKMK
nr:flavin reductase family protein [Cellulosilyticum sp. I15G10I2]